MNFSFDIQVDFHGLYVEDALKKLDKLVLDNDSVSIMVVHGHGMGALKTAIHDYCNNSKYVASFATGATLNLPGGDGITIIYTT